MGKRFLPEVNHGKFNPSVSFRWRVHNPKIEDASLTTYSRRADNVRRTLFLLTRVLFGLVGV